MNDGLYIWTLDGPVAVWSIPIDTKTYKVYYKDATMDELTEGRKIHFVKENDEHCAAVVTAVLDKEAGLINLETFDVDANIWVQAVRYSENHFPGTWHWIERA